MNKIDYQDQGLFCSGHVACGGCAEALSLRVVLNTAGPDTIAVVSPSCLAVICGGYPMTSLRIPVFHTTIESAAASGVGVKRALVAKGKPDTTVLVLAGDGGTYDIGLQALSSAAERNEDILYVCFDNEGYMNTGGQKSSSTPRGAVTGSTPAGKTTRKKNLIEIMAAHRIPYIATASPSDMNDFSAKIAKAKAIRGTKVIVILTPCLPGWGVADDAAVRISRLAVEARVFPLLEVRDGVHYTVHQPARQAEVKAYLEPQKRYSHLTGHDIAAITREVEADWQTLNARVHPENGESH